jgi:putative transposase
MSSGTPVPQTYVFHLPLRCLDPWPPLPVFNVLDEFNRDGLVIDADPSLSAARVIRTLERIIEWRGKSAAIRCDNGTEYVSGAMLRWADAQQIRIEYIQPVKSK